MYIRKVKKSESKSQRVMVLFLGLVVVYIRKVKKSESKSQQHTPEAHINTRLCISVKLKNLKANHNTSGDKSSAATVVYIRKVKKSESKSQHSTSRKAVAFGCVYP